MIVDQLRFYVLISLALLAFSPGASLADSSRHPNVGGGGDRDEAQLRIGARESEESVDDSSLRAYRETENQVSVQEVSTEQLYALGVSYPVDRVSIESFGDLDKALRAVVISESSPEKKIALRSDYQEYLGRLFANPSKFSGC